MRNITARAFFLTFALPLTGLVAVAACSGSDTNSTDPSAMAGASGSSETMGNAAGTSGNDGSIATGGTGTSMNPGAGGSDGVGLGGSTGNPGAGGADATGLGGATSGGNAGTGGNAGASGGASGASGSGRKYSTNPVDFGLGGPSRCGKAGVKLCDDFEGPSVGSNPDPSTWKLDTWGTGTAKIDDKHAARGKHSVHINEPANVSRVMLREIKTFPAPQNTFYGRFYLYLEHIPDPLMCANGCTNLVHWTAAASGGTYMTGGKNYQPDVRAVGAVNQGFLVNLDGASVREVGIGDDNPPAGQKAPVANKWMCFEFEYKGEGQAAEIRVWWDGLEHPGLHYSSTHVGDQKQLWEIPKYDHFDIGFAHYQDYSKFVSSFDAWIDEVAVDYERIGCDL